MCLCVCVPNAYSFYGFARAIDLGSNDMFTVIHSDTYGIVRGRWKFEVMQ